MRTRAYLGAAVLAAVSLPTAQRPSAVHAHGVTWQREGPGIDQTVIDVRGGGEGWNTRVVAVRVDPTVFRFRLTARIQGVFPGWSVDQAPDRAVVATNTGQFTGITPWGWVVMHGREIRPPGRGPLSTAIAWDKTGRVRWLEANEIDAERARGEITEAFQSYPTLLKVRGQIPREIRERGLGVDVDHHDGRLAIGVLEDGRVILSITRFNGLGDVIPSVPLGLTLAEMAEVMRGLGCVRAVSLDGGVSAQMLLQVNGQRQLWRGWRSVPLGLVAEPVRQAN
jgi:exopolysaccharide biosynthesis protein